MSGAVKGGSTLRDELHVHLYGCLTANDLFTLGKDRWASREARLEWYATEYEAAWGRRPDWRRYWQHDDGEELLRADFEFAGGEFAKFQACFNLAIALLPASATDTTVLAHVLETQAKTGLAYMEVRCFVPLTLTPDETKAYMAASARVATACERRHAGAFVPRLAFSLSRDPATFAIQYKVLRALMDDDQGFAKVVVGIDFCGVEEGNPPRQLRQPLATVAADNRRDPARALAVLYHVGESWGGMSQASAVRWVIEAHRMGAHRLGHALALGLSPDVVRNVRGENGTKETVAERRDHLRWLLGQEGWLRDLGHRIDRTRTAADLAALEGQDARHTIEIAHDDEFVADTKSLQTAVLTGLKELGGIIETCPTSNLLIGRIGTMANHPLPRFVASGVATVLAADDPGTFATTLAGEERIAREVFGFDDAEIARIAKTTRGSRSEHLVRRAQYQ